MATQEEIYRIIFDATGQDRLARSTADIYEFSDAIDETKEGMYAQARAAQESAAKTATVGQAADTATPKVEQLSRSAKQAAGTKSGSGQGLLALAFAVDDAQYGMRALANNIPGLLSQIGLGAGVAGVIGIATTAVVVFGDEIARAFNTSPIKTYKDVITDLEKELRRLESKPVKLEADFDVIDDMSDKIRDMREDLEGFEKVARQLSSGRKESAKRATEALAEFGGPTDEFEGGENVQRIVEQVFREVGETGAQRAQALREIADKQAEAVARADAGDSAMLDEVLQLQKTVREIDREAEKRAQAVIGGFERGDQKNVLQLIKIVNENAELFGRGGVDVAGLIGGLEAARLPVISAERRAEVEAKAQKEAEGKAEQEERKAREKEKELEKQAEEAKKPSDEMSKAVADYFETGEKLAKQQADIQEDRNKRLKKARESAEKVEAEEARRAEREAAKLMPGMEDELKFLAIQGFLGGGAKGDVQAGIGAQASRFLRSRGMQAGEAGAIGSALSESVMAELAAEMLNGEAQGLNTIQSMTAALQGILGNQQTMVNEYARINTVINTLERKSTDVARMLAQQRQNALNRGRQ